MKAIGALVMALLVGGILYSLYELTISDQPIGAENLVGEQLPAFAAPLATSSLEGDSNVYTKQQAEAAHATAACDVKLEGAFNSCKGLAGDAVLLFFNSTKDQCVEQVDRLNELAEQDPQLDVAAVAFDEDKPAVAATAKEHGWKIPVAVDRDGAVAGLYSSAGCPTWFFAHDGEINAVKLGVQTPAELEQLVSSYSEK